MERRDLKTFQKPLEEGRQGAGDGGQGRGRACRPPGCPRETPGASVSQEQRAVLGRGCKNRRARIKGTDVGTARVSIPSLQAKTETQPGTKPRTTGARRLPCSSLLSHAECSAPAISVPPPDTPRSELQAGDPLRRETQARKYSCFSHRRQTANHATRGSPREKQR